MEDHELDNYSDRLHPLNPSNWQSLVYERFDPDSSFTDEDNWDDWSDEDMIAALSDVTGSTRWYPKMTR